MTGAADRLEPPVVRVAGELVSNRRVGDYHHLTMTVDGVAERAHPGMFVALAVGHGTTASLLRRAFWIHRTRTTGARGGRVEVVVDVRGVGTNELAGLRPEDPVDMLGPLGRPYALPKEPVSCVVVGHEYAAAPLFLLAERLRQRGCAVHMVLGARTQGRLLGPVVAGRGVSSLTVTTDDGSVGLYGSVCAPLPELIDRTGSTVVYASATTPVLASVAQVAAEHGVWCQCAVEVPMGCGTGVCLTCAVPVTTEGGMARTVRACVDGPVLRGDQVRWEELADVGG
jgi:dihydroorotate dehydrogenase electron transfer subunit